MAATYEETVERALDEVRLLVLREGLAADLVLPIFERGLEATKAIEGCAPSPSGRLH